MVAPSDDGTWCGIDQVGGGGGSIPLWLKNKSDRLITTGLPDMTAASDGIVTVYCNHLFNADFLHVKCCNRVVVAAVFVPDSRACLGVAFQGEKSSNVRATVRVWLSCAHAKIRPRYSPRPKNTFPFFFWIFCACLKRPAKKEVLWLELRVDGGRTPKTASAPMLTQRVEEAIPRVVVGVAHRRRACGGP